MSKRRNGFSEHFAPFGSPEPAVNVLGTGGTRFGVHDRLIKAGLEAADDHDLLEMLLLIAVPRRDTKAIARALLVRFRNLQGVISAPLQDLLAIENVGEDDALVLKAVLAAALRLAGTSLPDC